MIALSHEVLASDDQMLFVIEGMRNPLNSWDKSDTHYGCMNYNGEERDCIDCKIFAPGECELKNPPLIMGTKDLGLMNRLSKAGTDHRKFMRMIPVMIRITAPLYWWKEFDTYKVGTVANSTSTMHKIASKEFTLDDFSKDRLFDRSINTMLHTIETLNFYRDLYLNGGEDHYENTSVTYKPKDKEVWYQLIQLLPDSYNQTRNVIFNYEVLANIYKSRKDHKLTEWHVFCEWVEDLPYSYLITGKDPNPSMNKDSLKVPTEITKDKDFMKKWSKGETTVTLSIPKDTFKGMKEEEIYDKDNK